MQDPSRITELAVLGSWSQAEVAHAATLASTLEVAAEKAGNITPTRQYADTTFADMVHSGAVLGPVLAQAGGRGVGASILAGVEATRRVAGANTNLGIVLLLVPLARAALTRGDDDLRTRVRAVLATLDLADAADAFAAILLAAPGGLGDAPSHDVRDEPTITLLEAMRAGAGRDGVAAEYATGYATTFERGLPLLRGALAAGTPLLDAIAEVALGLLAERPDTLIARKNGADVAAQVSREAAAVVAAGATRTADGRARLAAFDAALRRDGNRLNPGTTADLVAATLFVAILAGDLAREVKPA